MAVLNEKIRQLLESPGTYKCIATTSPGGVPHIAYKDSLHIEGSELVFYDLLQSSQTNKNLVHAIWFDQKVSISLLTEDRDNIQIIGHPVRCVTAGKHFEAVYDELKNQGFADLNAIWYIEPEKSRDNSYEARAEYEQKHHPLFQRLDNILKENTLYEEISS